LRVFKFLSAKWGREALRAQALKAATLEELNDPFELVPIDRSDAKLRRGLANWRQAVMADKALICFSKSWYNPVIWSHYADRHRGMCLGFDVDDSHLIHVNYRDTLIKQDEFIRNGSTIDPHIGLKLASTKFGHWRYEDEVRVFLRKSECRAYDEAEGPILLCDFDKIGPLRQVVLGENYSHSKTDMVLAKAQLGIEVVTARLAFTDFKVTTQLAKKKQKGI
jgi:hypothetical protein